MVEHLFFAIVTILGVTFNFCTKDITRMLFSMLLVHYQIPKRKLSNLNRGLLSQIQMVRTQWKTFCFQKKQVKLLVTKLLRYQCSGLWNISLTKA